MEIVCEWRWLAQRWHQLLHWFSHSGIFSCWYGSLLSYDQVSHADILKPGIDSIAHMSEETTRANVNIPRAMISSIIINGICAFAFILTVLYSISDAGAVMGTRTGYPVIEVFFQATKNTYAVTAMTSSLIIIFCLAMVASLASTSRLTWAFARDK